MEVMFFLRKMNFRQTLAFAWNFRGNAPKSHKKDEINKIYKLL